MFVLPSLVGVLIEAVGALLVATLFLVLQRTVRREPLGYWSVGWFALCIAQVALFLSLYFSFVRPLTQALYIFGDYLFAYLVVVGCRRHITGERPKRAEAWLVVPAILVAIVLPQMAGGEFPVFFTIHTLIYAYLFSLAFRALWRARPDHGSLTGLRVMKVALLLLTLDHAHYAPLYAAWSYGLLPQAGAYLVYSPLYDQLFLILLAFGMVMVMTGEVQHELEVANLRLARTRDRLQTMAQLDQLTSTLNRHAFHSILGDPATVDRGVLRGCAIVADIDGLKGFNDRYGHAAGDSAIREVATTIRACIRADDLLFRWGGDEFLILLIGATELDARSRLDSLNESLRRVVLVGLTEPVDISVSLGYANFDSAASLEDVIALADRAMYGTKRAAVTRIAKLR